MKKQLSTLALCAALLSSALGVAQIQPCNTYAAMEERFEKDPSAKARFDEVQAKLQREYLEYQTANNIAGKTAAVQYTIPVVFHILHVGGPENIPDATCINALAQINSDYARMGADTNTIFAPFKSLYINSDIKMMLAHKDPSGNCTNGIVHHYDTRTDWHQGSPSTNYTGITWDPTKYLNVIVVKQIIPTTTVTGNGIIVGYTYVPGTWPTGAPQDAIVYNYGFLTGLQARSLSHEMGHWFNLIHTFGNTNNPGVVCGSTAGGDGVSDTPDTKGNFSTCPASSTNTAYTCTSPNPGNPNNYYQNVENIMDYSSCPKNFTTGQTNRMRTALASAISGRSNLWSPTNITNTDVNGVLPCAPIAEFLSTTSYTVCSGGSLTMKDFSYNGTITNYSWVADNGSVPANPTASVTAFSFPNVGVTTITLTVSNGQGNSTKVRTVTVLNGTPGITGPAMESFEAATIPAGWSIINPSGVAWALTNTAAKAGTQSYVLDGSQSGAGQQDMLVMPIMDLLNNQNDSLWFSYAYAKQNSTYADKLVLQGSLDCGGTWIDVVSLSASSMANGSGGTTSTPFVPTASQWKDVNVSAYPYWFNMQNSPSVLFRFVFTEDPTNGFGNRIYIDAVNFVGTSTGINQLTKTYKLNIFPNPSNGEVTVKFNLNDAANVSLNVVDILGKEVLPSTNYNLNAGEQSISINKNSGLSKGIYFVNLSVNGAKMSKKLVIN